MDQATGQRPQNHAAPGGAPASCIAQNAALWFIRPNPQGSKRAPSPPQHRARHAVDLLLHRARPRQWHHRHGITAGETHAARA